MASVGDPRGTTRLVFEASDPADLTALRTWLRAQRPGLDAQLTAPRSTRGELGVIEVLTVLASSTVLSSAIKTLPEFIRSRRSGIRIDATARGQKVSIEATNVEEVLPILKKLLDDER
ncbi:effector-associated constant component EACC1 [Amycolatopsis pigmentata]|uniref:Uncharacterized protein n=1 Tax=Amycolatopsis pigmentata TaxID=450801 RepID=A0ABW5FNI9_9PSEU